MGYGFSGINDNGEIQVDAEYRNIQVEKSINRQISHSITENIQTLPEPPLVAFQPTSVFIFAPLYRTDSDGNYYEFLLSCRENSSTTTNIIVSRENIQNTPSGYGIKILNTSGELCFWSGVRYMKYIGSYPRSMGSAGDFPIQFSVHDASNYFLLIGDALDYYGDSDAGKLGESYIYKPAIRKIDSSTIEVDFAYAGKTPYIGSGDFVTDKIEVLEVSY